MSISLKIEITSPLSPADHDLLSGIAILTLAIANREMAEARFPETFPPDEDEGPFEGGNAFEDPCGAVDDDGAICVSRFGHRAPHRFLTIAELS